MRAIVYDGRLRVVGDHPEPSLRQGWAVIAVQLAGICRTDLEIVAGYMGFRGVLGHEFVGQVIACGESPWVGRRVVGEINASCGDCRTCASGMDRHCPSRTVLGILGLDGCLAERCALPVRNLHSVPAELSDAQAVFCEPLAAAYEMLEQIRIEPGDRCVVLGDGKLGILCAWVLATVSGDVTLMGRHPAKLDLARWGGVRCCAEVEDVLQADVVVEATGTPGGIMRALEICRPRGTVVLKSTVAADAGLNLARAVVNEVTIVGSRCGPFDKALRGLVDHRFPVERLISATFGLDDGAEALGLAARRGVLKVLVRP